MSEEELPDRPAQWVEWDGPALRAIAAWEDSDDSESGFLHASALFERLGTADDDRWKVARSLRRLRDDGLIDAVGEVKTLGMPRAYPGIVRSLTPAGLRETRRWPTEQTAGRIMIGVLLATADEVESTEPVEAARMRGVGAFLERLLTTGVSGFSTGLGGALGGQVLKGW